eukprot:5510224-Amphidinium_carterae.1
MSSTYLRTSTCLLALCKLRIRKACSRSTASPHPVNEDSSIPAVHVQRTIKGIERKSSLNGELFELGKWHSL